MTKNLVIVESPAKARTIERYLGDGSGSWLPTATSATCPRTPARASSASTSSTISRPSTSSTRIAASSSTPSSGGRGSDLVYLATDLDREGEAIAWHVVEAVDIPERQARAA